MCVVALVSLPYGYYTLLRLVVTGCAGFAAYRFWSMPKHQFMSFIFIGVGLLFNPFIPVHLNRSMWAPIDIVVAGIFISGWLIVSRKA